MHIYTQPQRVNKYIFSHDQQWISLWIKPISNELDITIQVIASQLSGHCDVINKQLWRHQAEWKPSEWDTGTMWKDHRFYHHLWICFVEQKIKCMYSCDKLFLHSLECYFGVYFPHCETVSALTRVLFWCLFPSLLCNLGNKHQNNPLVSTETVCQKSTYIILYIIHVFLYWDSTDVTGDKVDLYDSCVVMLAWLRNERL